MSPLLAIAILLLIFSGGAISQRVGPRGLSINCGETVGSEIDGIVWLPESAFIREGVPKNLSVPGLHPVLSVLRTFPYKQSDGHRQFCYSIHSIAGTKYLVRASFFYGGVNGKPDPPVFDLIVDGTLWAVVNTTADYARNLSSYYEGIYKARGRRVRLCLGANNYTDSDPFISSIEMIILGESVYNSTNFDRYAMGLVSRSSFGHNGPLFRYPEDRFNRYWQPYSNGLQSIKSPTNVSNLDLWNLPPLSIFESSLVTDNLIEPVNLLWPQFSLPNSTYYVALYFADSSTNSSRILDVSINGITFASNLRLNPSGICIFASEWVLSGSTMITVGSSLGSTLPPLINGGEVFSLVELGGLTLSRDVFALEDIRKNLVNVPSDWSGDPCLPVDFSWTGVTCEGTTIVRVVKLNLSNMNLSGSLSPRISQMTALTEIDLGNNNLSGSIPDLSSLNNLKKLDLRGNKFNGTLPWSLGDLDNLRELHLQGNKFEGSLPRSLGNLIELNDLFLQDNRFSGSLPLTLGNLINLRKLHLQNNTFTGDIPWVIGELDNLAELFVENNQFSGKIPSNLIRNGLNFRYLPGNNLSP